MADPKRNFETNTDGNIITQPLIGWTAATWGDIAALLRIEYAESQQALQGPHKTVQLVLTAPQCLELSGQLRTLAEKILQRNQDQKPSN